MKKIKAIGVLVLISTLVTFILCSCSSNLFEEKPNYEKTVELSEDNYTDYLTVTKKLVGTVQGLWGIIKPKIVIEVTPTEDDYVFKKTSMTIDISYFFMGTENLKTITVDIESNGCATETIYILSDYRDNSVYQVTGVSNPRVYSVQGICNIPCQHQYLDGDIITPASCLEKGIQNTICEKCEKQKKKSIPALGHAKSEEYLSYKKETCTKNGKIEYSCSRCNDKIPETVKALGHEYLGEDTILTKATCTENAYKILICNRCEYTETVIEENTALGHDEIVHAAQSPSCTNPGWEEYVACSRCEYTTYSEISARGHNIIEEITKEPNCTETGKKIIRCSECSLSTEKELPVKHALVEHAAKAPTCTESGWGAYVSCSKCEYCTKEIKAATGHTPVTLKGVAATCTSNGLTEGSKCKTCGYVIKEQQAIVATHSYGSWTVTKAATSTSEGSQYRTCSKCGNKETQTIPKLANVNISTTLSVNSSIKDWFNKQPSVTYVAVKNGNSYDVTVTVSWNLKSFHFLKITAEMDGAEEYSTTYDGRAGNASKTFKFTGIKSGTTKLKVSVTYV